MGIEQLALFWLNCLEACFFVTGLLFIASGIVHHLVGKDSFSVRWCGIIAVGLWVSTVGFHLLAGFGIFRGWALTVGVMFLLVIVRLTGYSFTIWLSNMRNDGENLRDFLLSETTPLQKCLLMILGIGAFLVLARDSLLPPLANDALTYHAVKAGMWVQSGHIGLMEAPGGWFNYRVYPGGGEALQALGMIPFHNDFLMGSVDFIHWVALIPALFLLGRCVGLEPKSSLIAGLFCLFLPVVLFSVGGCYVDIIFALALVLGLAFVSSFFLRRHVQYLLLGLMSLGVAGGVKYLAYAPICVVLLVIVFHISLRREKRILTLLIFCVALTLMLAPMTPWLVYNIPSQGHSYFPISFNVAGLRLSAHNPVVDWFLDQPQILPYDLKQESTAFVRLFLWPWETGYGWKLPNLGILSLLPLCVFPMAIVSLMRQQFWVGFLIFTSAGTLMGSYFLPDFTFIRQFYADFNSRFLLGAVFPVIVISVVVFQNFFRQRYLDFLLLASVLSLIIGIRIYWKSFELPYIALSSALIGLVVWTIFSGRCIHSAQHILKVIIVLVFCLTGLYLMRDNLRNETIVESYFFHEFPRYWIHAVGHVDSDAIPKRIAITGGPRQTGDNWFMYLFMGKHLQNIIYYIPITQSGKIRHQGPWASDEEQSDYESWLGRINLNKITEVMSFGPKSIELSWMLNHPDKFEQITGNSQDGLFRVKRTHQYLFDQSGEK